MKKRLFPVLLIILSLNGCSSNKTEVSTCEDSEITTLSETVSETESEPVSAETDEETDEKLADNIFRTKSGLVYMIPEEGSPEETEMFSESITDTFEILNVSIPFVKNYEKNAADFAAVLNAKYNTDVFYSNGNVTCCSILDELEEPEEITALTNAQTTDEYIILQKEIYEKVKKMVNGNYDWESYTLEQIADVGKYIQGVRGEAVCPTGKWDDLVYTGDENLEKFSDFFNALRFTQFPVYDRAQG